MIKEAQIWLGSRFFWACLCCFIVCNWFIFSCALLLFIDNGSLYAVRQQINRKTTLQSFVWDRSWGLYVRSSTRLLQAGPERRQDVAGASVNSASAPCTCYLVHASLRGLLLCSPGPAAHRTVRVRRRCLTGSRMMEQQSFRWRMAYLSVHTRVDDREEAWSAFSTLSLPRKSSTCFTASLGFSTWGMWPHCPTCLRIALGSSCCNRCRAPQHV